MPDFRAASAYSASQGWMIVQDDGGDADHGGIGGGVTPADLCGNLDTTCARRCDALNGVMCRKLLAAQLEALAPITNAAWDRQQHCQA